MERLKDEAHAAIAQRGQRLQIKLSDILTFQPVATGTGLIQQTDQRHEGGFAGTGDANNCDVFTGPYLGANPGQRHRFLLTVAIDLAQMLHSDQRR